MKLFRVAKRGLALIVIVLLLSAGGYLVDTRIINPTPVKSGCTFGVIAIPPTNAELLEDLPEVHSQNGVLRDILDARYADNVIDGCSVHLRSYNGLLTSETWRAKPGDVLQITLKNDMGDGGLKAHAMPGHTMEGDVNGTNLHTHGLHVSPTGHQDNPLISVQPGQIFNYAIQIPENQPPGTYWYHPHLHGRTAVQQSSGMSGALIVEGGLDEIPEIRAARERILVLQQITYDQTGHLEDFNAAFGPGAWRKSKRLTLVNGQVAPTITMRPGEIQRWRIIHAGTREDVSLELEGHALNEIAADGIALGRVTSWTTPLLLAPGYRSDVLVQADSLKPGEVSKTYDLVDEPLPAAETLQGQQAGDTIYLLLRRLVRLDKILRHFNPKPRQVLAHIVVAGQPLDMAMPSEASLRMLAPYKDITDAELTDTPQHVTFDVNFARCSKDGACFTGCIFGISGCKVAYMISGREFTERHHRILKVGKAAEWTVDAKIAIHPFHIHVNPFQTSRVEPDGKRHLIWKDTIQVSADDPPTKLRMRYEDFTGTAVLHCHILDHEDQGMMDLIELIR